MLNGIPFAGRPGSHSGNLNMHQPSKYLLCLESPRLAFAKALVGPKPPHIPAEDVTPTCLQHPSRKSKTGQGSECKCRWHPLTLHRHPSRPHVLQRRAVGCCEGCLDPERSESCPALNKRNRSWLEVSPHRAGEKKNRVTLFQTDFINMAIPLYSEKLSARPNSSAWIHGQSPSCHSGHYPPPAGKKTFCGKRM